MWPETVPETRGTLIDLDATTQVQWEFPVNSEYTLRLSEQAGTNGYVWNEPQITVTCGTVVRDDSFVTGYVQYFLTTGPVDCTETFTIYRPDWWTTEPSS